MTNVNTPHPQFGKRNSASNVNEKITIAVTMRVLSTLAANLYRFTNAAKLSRRGVGDVFGHRQLFTGAPESAFSALVRIDCP